MALLHRHRLNSSQNSSRSRQTTFSQSWLAGLLRNRAALHRVTLGIWHSLNKDVFTAPGEIPVEKSKARNLPEALEPSKAIGAPETVYLQIKGTPLPDTRMMPKKRWLYCICSDKREK